MFLPGFLIKSNIRYKRTDLRVSFPTAVFKIVMIVDDITGQIIQNKYLQMMNFVT